MNRIETISYTSHVANRKFKIKYSDLIVFVLLLPFVQQRSMQEFPAWMQMAYRYGGFFSATVVYARFFMRPQIIKGSIKRLLPVVLLWSSYIVITLLVYRAKIVNTFTNCYVLMAIAIFIDMEIQRHAFRVIKILAFVYTIYTLLNNILVVAFPNGVFDVKTSVFHKGHLLGDDNAIIYVALPAMLFLCLYSYLKKGRLTWFVWVNLLLCEFVFIRLWAGSALVCFALFIGMVYVGVYMKRIHPCIEIIAFIVLMLLIFFGGTSSFIQYFIINILHKTSSFSSRSYMWEHAFQLFTGSPIYGYGGYYTNGMYQYGKYSYPVHTPYLQMLVDGGLITVSCYFITLGKAYKKLERHFDMVESQIIAAGITAISLSYVFEWTQFYHMMMILTLAINIDKVLNVRSGIHEKVRIS